MATTLVSLPPLPRSPLPPSPPYSPDKQDIPIETLHLDPGLDTPNRSPLTSASFGTATSITSASDTIVKRRVVSDSDAPRVFDNSSRPIKPAVPVRLEDFELIRVIGKGCAGRVLLVRDTLTAQVHAMKAISKRSVFAADELRHTLAEMEIMKKFAIIEPGNPFVAKLHHSFTDRENFYLVMDFYPGGDLATQMELHGTLGHVRTRFYACDIVQGLEDLHRNGIVVRDLKPENILLNRFGHCVLADFGLSKDFGYRGDPRPLHVVRYPGQAPLPPWAGQGAGTLRVDMYGSKKLVVDRANSFVGTAEYLAPEVIKRAGYSYAVDWWALGIIMVECMIGRVPYRLDDRDPPSVMWHKILNDAWYDIFHDPVLGGHAPEYYGIDHVSWHLVDSLLDKDPMTRLTEPFVKQHDYFLGIDWESVSRGRYRDPHGLLFHPIPEYNTQYFPRLCLDEEPSVDMASHDAAYLEEHYSKQSPLNDNDLYLLEQVRYRAELEGFAWSREIEEGLEGDEVGGAEEEGEEDGVEEDAEEDEEDGAEEDEYCEERYDLEVDGGGENDERDDVDQIAGTEEICGTDEADGIHNPDTTDGIGEVTPFDQAEADTNMVDDNATASDFAGGDSSEDDDGASEEDETANVAILETASTDTEDDEADIESESNRNLAQLPLPGSPVLVAVEEACRVPLPSPVSTIESVPPTPPMKPRAILHPHPAEPITKGSTPRPIPQLLGASLVPPVEQDSDLVLPTAFPASGLSVSDLMAIPSPGLNSPGRIVRRHRALPSIDNTPRSRLSVDLHGTITNLDDDDWEQLDCEGVGSVPNGQPPIGASFFNRVLHRRPSTLYSSGLRRQAKTSETSTRSSIAGRIGSPTKKSPIPISLGTSATTKKAIDKISKAFPKLRKPSNPPSAHAPSSVTGELSKSPHVRRQTRSNSWFDRRPALGKRSSASESSGPPAARTVSAGLVPKLRDAGKMTMSRSASAMPVVRETGGMKASRTDVDIAKVASTPEQAKGVPRVELTKTPPLELGWLINGHGQQVMPEAKV